MSGDPAAPPGPGTPPGAPHIDHIGILVADLDAAIVRLTALFGGVPLRRELPDVGLAVAEFRAANIVIELLQYTEAGDSFARRVMGSRLGINHLSARVDDVATSLRRLKAGGWRPMDGFPRPGAHGEVVFFEPDPVTGLLFEICQPDSTRRGDP